MATPVWSLSVDLTTKTATFQSGLADAARSARGAFSEIKSGSGEMGGAVSTNMFEARHGVMLLGEEFGIKLPRALTAFITSIGPIGAAMEAAFPFLAIAVGATLLIQHLASLHAAGLKLTEDQVKFGTAVENAFNALDSRILQAQIRSDELRNDHLGALRHQLELIDKQSMAELVHSFEEVAKSADVVFADLKTSWYQFGAGSAGAKHALDEFQTKYDALLAAGKDKDASDLLKGTKESAEKILAAQKQYTSLDGNRGADTDEKWANQLKFSAARAVLDQAHIGASKDEMKVQQTLVDALEAQVGLETKIAQLKTMDKGNASTATGKEMAALAAEGARAAAEHRQKMSEIALSADREQTQAEMAIREASIAERLAADERLANEEYRIQQDGNKALIAALDKGGKDYNNQLRALQEKGEELTAQHNATISNLEAKAKEAQYREDLQNLTQGEREKIEATLQGSRERLAAIDAAIKEEQSKNLQSTEFYRDLLKQRVEVARQAAAEEAKLAEEAGKEEAENTQKMGELMLAATRQQQALIDSARRVSVQQRVAEEVNAANQEYALKLAAMQREAAALDTGAKDYENKLKAIQDKELQMVNEHENAVAEAKNKAVIDSNTKIISAENQFNNTLMAGLTQVLMGHKSFASMMNSLGNQVVSGMMQNALKSIEANMMGKTSDAEKAARQAYIIGQGMGGPAGVVLGPVFAAVAFSSMMAFEGGGIVPGIGRGDTVPAMLTPGEGVIPGGTMDQLNAMARSGNMGGGGTHYHAPIHYSPVIQAIDDTGVARMLNNHGKEFQRHVENTLRKLNR